MTPQRFLVLGATGRTGRRFLDIALGDGHAVRALTRNPAALPADRAGLEVVRGSITDDLDLDALVRDADGVVVLLGDAEAQQHALVNTEFVRALVPAMRRQGVTRLLYQAGGFSTPPGQRLPIVLRAVRGTIARAYLGQHRDNEAVMRYLAEEAMDLQWVVHRAAIGSDGPSKGVLRRSRRWLSVATFRDCAAYDYAALMDPTAVHTCDGSRYR